MVFRSLRLRPATIIATILFGLSMLRTARYLPKTNRFPDDSILHLADMFGPPASVHILSALAMYICSEIPSSGTPPGVVLLFAAAILNCRSKLTICSGVCFFFFRQDSLLS